MTRVLLGHALVDVSASMATAHQHVPQIADQGTGNGERHGGAHHDAPLGRHVFAHRLEVNGPDDAHELVAHFDGHELDMDARDRRGLGHTRGLDSLAHRRSLSRAAGGTARNHGQGRPEAPRGNRGMEVMPPAFRDRDGHGDAHVCVSGSGCEPAAAATSRIVATVRDTISITRLTTGCRRVRGVTSSPCNGPAILSARTGAGCRRADGGRRIAVLSVRRRCATKSPGIGHPVRSFAARMSMHCSTFFALLAVRLAPWRYRNTTTSKPPRTPQPNPGGSSE